MKGMYRRGISAMLLVSIVFTAVNTFAQRQRGGTSSGGIVPVKSEKKQTCSGGWSGVVTLTKTLRETLESDEPGIRKNTDRIIHKTSRNYDYNSRSIVDGTNAQEPVVTSTVNFTDTDLQWGQEKVFDTCNSRENGHWFIIEGNDDRQTQAQVTAPARSFTLYVDERGGTYSLSLRLPDAQGQYKREQHVRRTGHCQPKNNEPFDKSENEQVRIDGEGMSVTERLDPDHPDQISGSKVWGDDGRGEVRTFIYQATWRFTRCPQKLLITDLRFEHPKFPNFEQWQEIEEIKGTVDGNRVKVKAKVLNMSGETKYADLKLSETYKGDKYNGARPDEMLPEGQTSLRLEAGEEREVEMIWDVEGQSWFDDGRPHLLHRIKAELTENGQKRDEREKPLNIAPKPVLLVNGLWEDYRVWEPLYQNLFSQGHSYHWKAFPVGEKPEHGVLNTGGKFLSETPAASVYDNADQLAKYVRFAQEETNAWHVDMVAHSTGGLIGRLYIHKLMPVSPDARPTVKHLIMLGTPNGGVPCIDVFVGKLDLFGKQLGAAKELTNDEMLNFNRFVVNTGGTKFSALAGNPVPVVCGGLEWNDGFVTVRSATHGVADTGQVNDLHPQLTGAKDFGAFVKPHLVTGPRGTYPIPVRNDPVDWRRWQVGQGGTTGSLTKAYRLDETFAALVRPHGPNAAEAVFTGTQPNSSFSKQVSLAARQVVEIEVPVEAAPNFGLTFMAGPAVSVSLINERGVVVSKNLAGTPDAASMFRQVFTSRPVETAKWRLRLENTEDTDAEFAGFTWTTDAFPPK